MFPPGTNGDYNGSLISAYGLTLLSLLTIGPGFIHAFLPDGGAVAIAGLDISGNPKLIVGVFAWLGATQIVWGALMLLVSLFYRSLVPLILLLSLVQLGINAMNQHAFESVYGALMDPASSPHHPPEMYATVVTIPIVILLLGLSLVRRK